MAIKKDNEIFEVERKGKTKIVKTTAVENVSEESPSKNQLEKENKILRNIFIGIAVIFVLIVVIIFIVREIRHYNYNGVDFEAVKYGDLIVYKTSLPVKYNGTNTTYNFYLRTNPKDLKAVPFEGNITFRDYLVINTTNELNCEGYGGLAVANVVKLYDVSGIKSIKDENASCDILGRYMYLNVILGNETIVKQYGLSCYEVQVSNCEVLPATEKFMAESLVAINKIMKSKK
jgi:hypothetical protein